MALRLVQRGLEHLDLVRPLQFRLGVGEPRLGLLHARPCAAATEASCSELSSVKIGSPCLTAVAFLDAELGDAAALLGADQNEIGLHIAGELGVLVGVEGHQHEDDGDRGDDRRRGAAMRFIALSLCRFAAAAP